MTQRERESASATTDLSFRRLLLDAARPTLYQANAFRITGLGVHASPREIARQADRMEITARLGGDVPRSASPFAIAPPPDRDVVRDAIDRLRSPERRLLEELFWFWPHDPADPKSDVALRLLARGDVGGAIDIWKSVVLSGSDGCAERHNLAVYAHLRALETPAAGDAEQLWADALRHWKELLADDTHWSRLASRIAELDDPRLTTGLARRIRNDMPRVLVSISGAIAMEAAERNDLATVRRQAKVVRGWGFDAQIVRETLQTAIAPVRQRLRARCAAVNTEAKANPRIADAVVQKAMTEVSSLLLVFDFFFEPGDLMRDGVHDEVATALFEAVIEYVSETQAWLRGAALCERLLVMAVREPAKKKIADMVGTLRQNATTGMDWCTPGYFELPPPVLDVLQTARKKTRESQVDAAMSMIAAYIARSGDTRPPVLATLAWCLATKAFAARESLSARAESMARASFLAQFMPIARMLLLAHELMPGDTTYRDAFTNTKKFLDEGGVQYPSSAELRMSLGIGHAVIPAIPLPAPAAAAAASGCLVALAAVFALVFIAMACVRIAAGPCTFTITKRRPPCPAPQLTSESTSVRPTAASPVWRARPSASFATTKDPRPPLPPFMSTAPTRCASAARPRSGSRMTATTRSASSSRRWEPTMRRSSAAPAAG
jgi:hypothetical protein